MEEVPPRVAPHAGVWIETMGCIQAMQTNFVAPHAGVWIETHGCIVTGGWADVAPHAGVWIETSTSMSEVWKPKSSRPTRACGLKPL